MAAGHIVVWRCVSLQGSRDLLVPWQTAEVCAWVCRSPHPARCPLLLEQSVTLTEVCPFLCTQVFVAFTHRCLKSRNGTVLLAFSHQAACACLEIPSL